MTISRIVSSFFTRSPWYDITENSVETEDLHKTFSPTHRNWVENKLWLLDDLSMMR